MFAMKQSSVTGYLAGSQPSIFGLCRILVFVPVPSQKYDFVLPCLVWAVN